MTKENLETAIFAGGCFWCMEPVFDKLDGVASVMPGYTGGHVKDPTYEEVCEGDTGHVEAVRIEFDPSKVTYRQLIDIFWRNIDPTVINRQFCDYGTQYQTAVFYTNEEQKRVAEESRKELEEGRVVPKPIRTEIRPASEFYVAEDYHRQFYIKNQLRYENYHRACGRDGQLKALWKGK
ncbi:peptide-methionine (S)-S-oxide reductase MsrA [Geomesophilobacter sediminis]|uniref:Peptide methionine sulfoxide reductase MsrA n=1 Tax=Geomesophilobacter sediminis TaxID=2798584 RepID=A0A8J7IQ45_9BACT|nr:peptide-methionine (S)-S-oxide reductase MsrA [Geomesophilobacter sediminis]MBJ6725883.1 peptide-methionine (S)-S-oxide reductase MsrA [Geomesophilobacter sediminis]